MLNDKFKIILTKEQLDVIFIRVRKVTSERPDLMADKLMTSIMLGIYKKLLLKWSFPSSRNHISLTVPEAIAFWLTFNNFDFYDPFVSATMRTILNNIHQKFI